MSLNIKQRRELRAVTAIGKPVEPALTWLDSAWHDDPDGYQRASTHNTVDAFRARQIARGMVPKEGK